MENSKKKYSHRIVIIVLLSLQLIVTSVIAVYYATLYYKHNISSELKFDNIKNGKYILYIGTNDKDSYTQKIPLEEAKTKINAICSKYVEGYSVFDAKGGWVDETGTLTEENTLVYSFVDVKEQDIIAIMDEALIAMNQNSIMVERQDSTYCYYNGK